MQDRLHRRRRRRTRVRADLNRLAARRNRPGDVRERHAEPRGIGRGAPRSGGGPPRLRRFLPRTGLGVGHGRDRRELPRGGRYRTGCSGGGVASAPDSSAPYIRLRMSASWPAANAMYRSRIDRGAVIGRIISVRCGPGSISGDAAPGDPNRDQRRSNRIRRRSSTMTVATILFVMRAAAIGADRSSSLHRSPRAGCLIESRRRA